MSRSLEQGAGERVVSFGQGKAREDNWARIFLRLEAGVGPELVGGIPQPFFKGASDAIPFR